MAAVLKTAVVMSHRGFESLSLRQSLFEYEMAVFESLQAVFEVISIAEDAGTDLLFVTLVKGRSGDHAPISESSVQHLLSLLGRKAEIGKPVYPHLFRHSLATNLLRRNVNPVQVRDILGHSSLAMIDRVYSHLVASDAHQALMEALRAES
jgi:integrase